MDIIIIIGLPGSGKSYLSNTYKEQGYIVHDDFISKFWNGQVLNDIENSKKVCLNDPRLCQIDVFNRIVDRITKINNNIKLILFSNEPTKCLINALTRKDERQNDKKYAKGIENNILEYSKIYNLENYSKWNHEIVDVVDVVT